jgi:hypothetical protein
VVGLGHEAHTIAIYQGIVTHHPSLRANAGSAGKGADDADDDLVPESRWGATYATQFRVLLSRAVRVRRFQALSIQVNMC